MNQVNINQEAKSSQGDGQSEFQKLLFALRRERELYGEEKEIISRHVRAIKQLPETDPIKSGEDKAQEPISMMDLLWAEVRYLQKINVDIERISKHLQGIVGN